MWWCIGKSCFILRIFCLNVFVSLKMVVLRIVRIVLCFMSVMILIVMLVENFVKIVFFKIFRRELRRVVGFV